MDRAASSYVSGVTVKISEKYRPPRKPTLPAGLCIIEPPAHLFAANFDRIDEAGVLSLIEKLKRKKNEEVRARKQRIAELELKIAEEKEEQPEGKDVGDSTCASSKIETTDPIVASPVMPATRNGPTPMLNHVSMPVLTPIQSSTIEEKTKEKLNAINIAEFENFSTNPFEDMELKTLNDKEELALLLQPTPQPPIPGQPPHPAQLTLGMPYNTHASVGMQWPSRTDATYPHQPPNLQYSNPSSDWIHSSNLQPFNQQTFEERIGKISLNNDFFPPQANSATPQGILRQVKSVPDLSDIGDKRLSSRTPPPRLSSGVISKPSPSRSILNAEPSVERNLKPHEKLLARQLSDMGFPRDLCARVIARVGASEKDVLDQLLVIQKLEDKGYIRHRIESILELVKPCQDVLKVLEEHLRLSEQLSALGFDEKKVDSALLAAGLDRDKALDILLMM
uniref:EOG090X07V0 n=1 Tax=Moina brachiata TaxID=675436 RepID=A0A4Y7NKF3_9CRUS|nr:EOG090X07V0 [Moina brachiata]